mmetsp:Transcript_20176/g.51516  ORF Transcript_20176/g.51516 Transcript_20176/m.51516 type:complete len:250 (+) Transcript_20176:417-1166(+)
MPLEATGRLPELRVGVKGALLRRPGHGRQRHGGVAVRGFLARRQKAGGFAALGALGGEHRRPWSRLGPCAAHATRTAGIDGLDHAHRAATAVAAEAGEVTDHGDFRQGGVRGRPTGAAARDVRLGGAADAGAEVRVGGAWWAAGLAVRNDGAGIAACGARSAGRTVMSLLGRLIFGGHLHCARLDFPRLALRLRRDDPLAGGRSRGVPLHGGPQLVRDGCHWRQGRRPAPRDAQLLLVEQHKVQRRNLL